MFVAVTIIPFSQAPDCSSKKYSQHLSYDFLSFFLSFFLFCFCFLTEMLAGVVDALRKTLGTGCSRGGVTQYSTSPNHSDFPTSLICG